MDKKFETKASKCLSFILRHHKGLWRDAEAYARVGDVLLMLAQEGYSMSSEDLCGIVHRDEKGRYSFDWSNNFIRANQGHSVEGVNPLRATDMIEPGTKFYHGTAFHFLKDIAYMGIEKMARTHVHLSQEMDTALSVGKRHTGGKEEYVAILEVDAHAMYLDGFQFYISDNDVILVDRVPPEYVTVRVKLKAFSG